MKKYNSIAITLIVLGMLANSWGTALAESSEPFPDEEWNRTYQVGEIYHVQCIQNTSDGGYMMGFQLVKFGGVRHEPLQSAPIPNSQGSFKCKPDSTPSRKYCWI